MRRLLGFLLLLLAPSLLAQSRQPFPEDFKPSACAEPSKICKSFNQSQFADIAALRGYDIGQEWVDAHWKELTEAMGPMCAKIATCFATQGVDYLFCNDLLQSEVYRICDRYGPTTTDRTVTDRTKCDWFVRIYWTGHDRLSETPYQEMQACVAANAQANAPERTFEWWMEPAAIGPEYKGFFTVYAIDTETRVPVQAKLRIESKEPIDAEDSPDGLPTTYYRVPWKPQFVRVPNAQGHQDLEAPEVRIEAPGYRTASFTLPVTVPKLVLEMNPPASKLKRGKNTVTITARDAETGQPVDARVMLGELVAGKTNVPFALELQRGVKRPEIWVTSLWDRYHDTVVAPAER